MRDHVAICFENISRLRATIAALVAFAACLSACSERARDPVEALSSDAALGSDKSAAVARTLQRGVYLIEARERGIDARINVVTGGKSTTLENRLPRYGAVFKVVSLDAPTDVRIEAVSADHGANHGNVTIRISRWARAPGEPATALESGYVAESAAAEQAAVATSESWARAADLLHEALTHFEAADADAARAEAAYTLAEVQYAARSQYAAAVRACETASEAFQRADDQVGVHDVATLRAAAEIELAAAMEADSQRAEQRAMFAEADQRLAEAAVFFAAHSLPIRAQYAVNMRAVRAINVGDYDGAATMFARSIEMAHANHDVREESRSLANLAAVHAYRGYMEQAAQEYEALLPLSEPGTYQYAVTLGNLGVTLVARGDFDRALAVHTEALELYSRLNKEHEKAVELAALGILYFRMGDTQRALDTLRSAIVAQEKVSDTSGLTGTLRVAGNAASALGLHSAALEYLRWSARIDANPHSVGRTLVLIAGELRTTGDIAGAQAALADPLKSSNELVQANALEERARIRLARHDTKAAIDDLRNADGHYASLGLEINRIDTSTALSQALLGTGDVSGARAAADDAISIVNRIRVKSANPEWRARFLSARYSPYEARIAADLAATDPDAVWRAFRTAEDVRGRSLADELALAASGSKRRIDPREDTLRVQLTAQQVRLESRIQRADADPAATQDLRREIAETRAQIDVLQARHGVAASARSTLSESLRDVQRALPPYTAVLAYFVGDTGGHAWVLTADSLKHSSLPGRTVLEHAVIDAQREERGGTATGPANRKLATLLLHDMLAGRNEQRLLVLADGPLNSVPFAALPEPDGDGRLLVDRFVIANAPSLALAMSSPARARSRNTRVAVISDPVYAPDDRRLSVAMTEAGRNFRGPSTPSPNNLTRLPYSALEASAVAKTIGASDTIQLSGFDAVPQRVIELPSKELAVLHFATHAVARDDAPEQSALYLTEYSPDGSRLPLTRLTVTDIARSGLRADVVVLSGCATGDGSALRGEGVLGLTYGFLANGSDSVVASLWPIEDASTARFMNEFYRAYRESGRAADALRAAQLRTRGSAAPGVWSSFVVRANEFP